MFEEPQQEYKPPSHILCRWCDKPIFMGDRSVYMHHGVVGRGRKSGNPVVVDDDLTSGEAVMHELCSVSYLIMSVVDSAEEGEAVVDTLTADMFGTPYSELMQQEELCANCEAKLDADD